MPPGFPGSIRSALNSGSDCPARYLWSRTAGIHLRSLVNGTCLSGRLLELSGRSILVAAREQFAAALALIELDGVAGQLIIYPPDVPETHLPEVIARGGVDVIVSDDDPGHDGPAAGPLRVRCHGAVTPVTRQHAAHHPTEWVLLTSGTTGAPKMIVHTLGSLTAPIKTRQNAGPDVVWGTFYDIRRYGGLQILLRVLVGHGSFVVPGTAEPVADYLVRLGAHGVTHMSGTPSHWRRALMSPQARAIAPSYIRLSGEIADQGILNSLHSFYPQARVVHAFASTEAGVGFEVTDGLEGFPATLPGAQADVDIKIDDGSLRLRSARTALRYVGGEGGLLMDDEGFVDTGDVVERRGDRYYFLGRRNGVINIGGMKVYPEEVEAVINRHPAVRMSIVRARKNPIIGSLVSADVVLRGEIDQEAGHSRVEDLKREILRICRASLATHKVPATIRCVPALEVAAAGKLVRHPA